MNAIDKEMKVEFEKLVICESKFDYLSVVVVVAVVDVNRHQLESWQVINESNLSSKFCEIPRSPVRSFRLISSICSWTVIRIGLERSRRKAPLLEMCVGLVHNNSYRAAAVLTTNKYINVLMSPASTSKRQDSGVTQHAVNHATQTFPDISIISPSAFSGCKETIVKQLCLGRQLL